MKALIFNHHPDYVWQLQETLKHLNLDVYIATHELTHQLGASYCSSSPDYKLRTGPVWYDEEQLFGEKVFKYANSIEDMDYIFSMNRDVVNNITFNKDRLFFIACVSWDLEQMNNFSKYSKLTSHHDAKLYGANYLPYFVPQRGELKTKTYITQLIEGYKNTPYYEELLYLKNNNYPVVIAGSQEAPDGIVDDWHTLQNTTLLVHHKEYGTNCNAVMKALDTGIPVYISKQNRLKIGMKDLPDELFLYSDDYRIHEAYNKSLDIDNQKIQNIFRQIRNKQIASEHLKKLL